VVQLIDAFLEHWFGGSHDKRRVRRDVELDISELGQ
jgi:hypothetical protein